MTLESQVFLTNLEIFSTMATGTDPGFMFTESFSVSLWEGDGSIL